MYSRYCHCGPKMDRLIKTNNQLYDDVKNLKENIDVLQKHLANLQSITNTSRYCNNMINAYFWTHGRTRNSHYMSTTCRNWNKGHQESATLDNNMGDSTHICKQYSWAIVINNDKLYKYFFINNSNYDTPISSWYSMYISLSHSAQLPTRFTRTINCCNTPK